MGPPITNLPSGFTYLDSWSGWLLTRGHSLSNIPQGFGWLDPGCGRVLLPGLLQRPLLLPCQTPSCSQCSPFKLPRLFPRPPRACAPWTKCAATAPFPGAPFSMLGKPRPFGILPGESPSPDFSPAACSLWPLPSKFPPLELPRSTGAALLTWSLPSNSHTSWPLPLVCQAVRYYRTWPGKLFPCGLQPPGQDDTTHPSPAGCDFLWPGPSCGV